MPSGKTIRSGESAGISTALKPTNMATLMAAFGDAKSPTLNSGTRCMSGPVFAIRVPPRLQEVIPPTIKDVKSSGQHAKNRRRKVGMRVRMTGAGREYVWGRIGTMTSVYRLSASLESCSGVVQRSRAATPTDTFVCFIEGADAERGPNGVGLETRYPAGL